MKKLKFKIFQSISAKIFIIFLVITVFLQLIDFIISVQYQSQETERYLIERNKVIASFASHRIVMGYLNNEWPLEYLAKIKESPDIVYWRIIKPDGLIYQADDPEIWNKKIEKAPWDKENASVGVYDSIFYKTGKRIKIITYPIDIGKSPWTFCLGISLEGIYSAQKHLSIDYLYIFLLSIIIVFFISIIFAKLIASPINRLTKVTRRIAQKGDLSQKVKVKTKDEIGILADSFNAMVTSLKISYDKLNISKRKEKTIRERLEIIMRSMGDGVFVVDKNKKILLFNKKLEEFSGWSHKQARGMPCSEVVKMFNPTKKINICKKDCPVDKVFKTGKVVPLSNNVCLTNKNGELLSVAGSAAPIKDTKGHTIDSVVILRDVTKEREINRAKSEFVSLASHQLRTPLTGIKWFLELLIKEKAGKLNKKTKNYLQQVFISNERMIKLVNDLLNISRIESGKNFKIIKQNVNIDDILDKVLENVSIFAKQRKIRIIKKLSIKNVQIMVDLDKLVYILENILNNAIKYSEPDNNVEIACYKKDKKVIFSVKDNGIGIPISQQKRIFQKFFRADNAVLKDSVGSGLGLYVAKNIIDAHHGNIWFESQGKKGTIFYVSLPLKKYK